MNKQGRRKSLVEIAITRQTPFEKLPTWMSIPEIATYTGVSESSASATVHSLPHKKIGRHYRVSKFFFEPVKSRA